MKKLILVCIFLLMADFINAQSVKFGAHLGYTLNNLNVKKPNVSSFKSAIDYNFVNKSQSLIFGPYIQTKRFLLGINLDLVNFQYDIFDLDKIENPHDVWAEKNYFILDNIENTSGVLPGYNDFGSNLNAMFTILKIDDFNINFMAEAGFKSIAKRSTEVLSKEENTNNYFFNTYDLTFDKYVYYNPKIELEYKGKLRNSALYFQTGVHLLDMKYTMKRGTKVAGSTGAYSYETSSFASQNASWLMSIGIRVNVF